ncbi:DUF3054 domain-containing protein [Rhodococcus sp. MEB064]|uniref:DUF3054 domain-containing protein n=1 Tax=Rhodococcus sp. MEB064 TaxID=1587522 RepID=UPI0005ACAC92|nr:DUF3054 domain-containing protein [Rhodococcus sp. MEB064]
MTAPVRTRSLAVSAVLDVVLVLVFSAIGRSSHAEGVTAGGVVSTAWPFLVGLVVGWAVTYALYREKFVADSLVPTGVIAWIGTVLVGMLLRQLTDEGTAFSFIVVASVTLGIFLLGWRAIARFVRTRR